jgi:tripartite-type tricarboxylate transporter receptor subunit TctC
MLGMCRWSYDIARDRSDREAEWAYGLLWPRVAYATYARTTPNKVGSRMSFRLPISSGLLALLAAALWCASPAASAAEAAYPSKLVRVVVPFAAGGSTDLLARNIAQRLNEAWKQPVIVENRVGGAGIVGSELVAKSPPDGYTLLIGTVTTHAVAATLYQKLPYDVQKSFAPITEFAYTAQLLSVHPSIPTKSVKELVALARARPGALNYGSAGNGTTSHMAMELFKSMAKVNIVHVPYKGTGPAMTDLLGGHIALMFDVLMTSLPHMQSGKLRTIGISSLNRDRLAPDVPTIAESGYPGYEAPVWFGLFTSAGTPPEIVRRIQEEIARALATPKMRELLASQGLVVVASPPTDFAARVGSEITKWRKVIREAGITLE